MSSPSRDELLEVLLHLCDLQSALSIKDWPWSFDCQRQLRPMVAAIEGWLGRGLEELRDPTALVVVLRRVVDDAMRDLLAMLNQLDP